MKCYRAQLVFSEVLASTHARIIKASKKGLRQCEKNPLTHCLLLTIAGQCLQPSERTTRPSRCRLERKTTLSLHLSLILKPLEKTFCLGPLNPRERFSRCNQELTTASSSAAVVQEQRAEFVHRAAETDVRVVLLHPVCSHNRTQVQHVCAVAVLADFTAAGGVRGALEEKRLIRQVPQRKAAASAACTGCRWAGTKQTRSVSCCAGAPRILSHTTPALLSQTVLHLLDDVLGG
jgi:hypothetical protein